MRDRTVQVRTHRFSDALAERCSTRLIATDVARGLLGEHANDHRHFRIARHGDLEFECRCVHDYTEIRLKRWSARRRSASICARSASTLSNRRSSRNRWTNDNRTRRP